MLSVDDLDAKKLSPLLKLKYNALNDAIKDLGSPNRFRKCSSGSAAFV